MDHSSCLPSELLALFSGDGKRIVAVLESFMDESGTHAGAPVLCVASCLGSHEKWTKFLAKWGTPDFHSRNPRSNVLKPKLCDLINGCELDIVVSHLEPVGYKTKTSNQWRSAIGNAYAVCAFGCAIGARKVFPHDKVAHVVAAGQPNAEWVERTLKALALRPDFRGFIVSVALAQISEFVQLHVADFIAHSWSTRNTKWLNRIDDGRMHEIDVTKQIQGMSEQLAQIVKKRRAEMRRLRKNGMLGWLNEDQNTKGKTT